MRQSHFYRLYRNGKPESVNLLSGQVPLWPGQPLDLSTNSAKVVSVLPSVLSIDTLVVRGRTEE